MITEHEFCVEKTYFDCDNDAVQDGPTTGIAYEQICGRVQRFSEGDQSDNVDAQKQCEDNR